VVRLKGWEGFQFEFVVFLAIFRLEFEQNHHFLEEQNIPWPA
jgi:hypothetical protein